MNSYRVAIKENIAIILEAKMVKVKADNTLVFFNPRTNVSEQYIYGSEIIATFKPDEYQYFYKN